MENKLSVHQQKASWKQPSKAKNKRPVKVVYISNPMKVKASAEEFRSVVQELTGQDSDVANLFSSAPADFADPPANTKAEPSGGGGGAEAQAKEEASPQPAGAADVLSGSFESFAEAFSPQMLDVVGYNSPPSPLYYEGNGFRNL